MRDNIDGGLVMGGKTQRVYLLLRGLIFSGEYPHGTVLPGENRLAEMHNVSRVTVRRALEKLGNDGFIEKRNGAGSVVCLNETPGGIAEDLCSFVPQIMATGPDTDVRLLSFIYGEPTPKVGRGLGLGDGARVQIAVRVRSHNGAPFAHITTHVPEAIAKHHSETDLANAPLCQLLEGGGYKIDRAHQTVTATLAAPDVAEALGVAVGSALLSLTRIVTDAEGRGVEYLSALYRPDLFRLEMSLARVGDAANRHWSPVIAQRGE